MSQDMFDGPSNPESSKLPKVIVDEEIPSDVWDDPAAALKHFDRYTEPSAAYLFVTKLLQLRAETRAVVNGNEHHLIEGIGWLKQLVTDQVVSQLQDNGIIRRPLIKENGEYKPRQQIARRSFYQLTDKTLQLADGQKLHGIIERFPQKEMALRAGDPNEGIVHRVGVLLVAKLFDAFGFDVWTYVQLPNNKIVDVWPQSDDGHYVVEVECKPDDAEHLRSDALVLSELDGQALWVMPTRLNVNNTLTTMANSGLISRKPGTTGWPDTLPLKKSRSRVREICQMNLYDTSEFSAPPVEVVESFDGVRSRLTDEAPEVFYK